MLAIDLKDILERTVRDPYGNLVTRRTGQAVRHEVLRALDGVAGDVPAAIDFGAVRCLDFSCADEIVGKLLLAVAGGRSLVLRGVDPSQRDAIEPVLERHGLAVAALDRSGQWDLLGPVPDAVRQVFRLLVDAGDTDAPGVAERLALSLEHAEQALRELHDLRLVGAGWRAAGTA